MGVQLSLDDFGKGQSSMSYLKRLPLDQIKIDRSFVMGMAGDESDAAIVRTTIDLGRNLGLEVVAEGVETDEVLSDLAALRCDVAQGFGLSRPLPAGSSAAPSGLSSLSAARGVGAASASSGLGDLARLEAAGAGVDAPRRSVDERADLLQVGVEATAGRDHRVAAAVAERGTLPARVTDPGHRRAV